MKASDFKRLVGKRVRAWTHLDLGRYEWKYLCQRPTFSGTVGEVRGRNVMIGGDYRWAPDIGKVEEVS